MDLVRTIDDEDVSAGVEEDQEEDDEEEVDTGFSFSFGKTTTPSSWDFKTAKKSMLDFDESKSVDAKISKRLEKIEIKKQKQAQKKKTKHTIDNENEFAVEGSDAEQEDEDKIIEEEEKEERKLAEDVLTDVNKSSKQKKKKSKSIKEEAMDDEESQKMKEKFFGKKPEMEISFQWDELQLSRPILKAIQQLEYKKPTPVQCQCIPLILGGHDICGSAVTGSGKTAAFVIPVLQRLLFRDKHNLAIRVVILSPTRELAVQCQAVIEKLAKFTDIRAVLSVGGLSGVQQETALRSLPDIVVATPGRLIDHVRNAKAVNLDDVEIFIMDEADRLLEMGFSAEIEEIMKFLPPQRQTLLFSATMTEEVSKLAKLSMKKPIRISVNPSFTTASTLSQEFIKLKGEREASREAMLLALCKRTVKSKAVIFCKNKFQAHRLKILFGLCKLNAAELHGNLTQNQRLDSLESFREGKADYLLATDLAARGLDILGVETVINFEMPLNLTDYVHRVGRTARAGEKGKAISFAGDKDKKLVKQVLDKAQDKVKQRILPLEEVTKSRNEIESLENDIQIIMKQERVEAELRKADLEQRKAENMMQFETEIYNKPKKTWFQSEKQKASVKEKSKMETLGITEEATPKLTKQQEREQKAKQKANIQREASKPRSVRRQKKFEKTESEDAKFVRSLSKNRLKKRKRESEETAPTKKRKGAPTVPSIEDELRGSSVAGSRGLIRQMQRFDKRKEKSQKKGQKMLAKRMAKKNGGGKRR